MFTHLSASNTGQYHVFAANQFVCLTVTCCCLALRRCWRVLTSLLLPSVRRCWNVELDDASFNKLVYRLNRNVLQLCFAQRLAPDTLSKLESLRNLQTLLDCAQLGT